MIVRTKGIILHTTKYAESSIICKMYTETHGLLSFIVSGARSLKSKEKTGVFSRGNIIEIIFSYKENKTLHRVSEFKLAFHYIKTPVDYRLNAILLFLIELFYKTIREENSPSHDLYEYVESQFIQLENESFISANLPLYTMIEYTKWLGFYPNISQDDMYFDLLSGESSDAKPNHELYISKEPLNVLKKMLQTTVSEIENIKLNSEQRRYLIHIMQDYYAAHIENFYRLNTPEILHEILG